MDAPVILLVPHTWHLEPKEWTAITPLPPPLAVTSSERRVISPRTSFALIHEDSQRVQGSVEETALWLQQATTAQSVTLILPPSVEPSRLLSCLPASSPLLCVQWFLIIHRQIIFSSSVGSPILTIDDHPASLLTWKSRSCWCPPAVASYSLIQRASRFFSMPWILPVEADSLVYACASVSDAMARVAEYEAKMLKKLSSGCQPCVRTVLRSGGSVARE